MRESLNNKQCKNYRRRNQFVTSDLVYSGSNDVSKKNSLEQPFRAERAKIHFLKQKCNFRLTRVSKTRGSVSYKTQAFRKTYRVNDGMSKKIVSQSDFSTC